MTVNFFQIIDTLFGQKLLGKMNKEEIKKLNLAFGENLRKIRDSKKFHCCNCLTIARLMKAKYQRLNMAGLI